MKLTSEAKQHIIYILGYSCFVIIPVLGLTAIILLGNHLTGYIYNHITRTPILVDIIDFAIMLVIFLICMYAVMFFANMMKKVKK